MDSEDEMVLSASDVMAWQKSVVAEWGETAAEVAIRATVHGLDSRRVERAVEHSGLSRERWMEALSRMQRELLDSLDSP